MRLLIFLFAVASLSAQTLSEQFGVVSRRADRLEVQWRDEFLDDLALIGVKTEKKVYVGAMISDFASHIKFEVDIPKPPPPPSLPGAVFTGPMNCLCDGSHLLRFYRGEEMIGELSFHGGTHLRSRLLNNGHDASLTKESQKWLRDETSFDEALAKAEVYSKKKNGANQAPVPTATSVTPAADAPVAPAAAAAQL